jgi:hypothetical protein
MGKIASGIVAAIHHSKYAKEKGQPEKFTWGPVCGKNRASPKSLFKLWIFAINRP